MRRSNILVQAHNSKKIPNFQSGGFKLPNFPFGYALGSPPVEFVFWTISGWQTWTSAIVTSGDWTGKKILVLFCFCLLQIRTLKWPERRIQCPKPKRKFSTSSTQKYQQNIHLCCVNCDFHSWTRDAEGIWTVIGLWKLPSSTSNLY